MRDPWGEDAEALPEALGVVPESLEVKHSMRRRVDQEDDEVPRQASIPTLHPINRKPQTLRDSPPRLQLPPQLLLHPRHILLQLPQHLVILLALFQIPVKKPPEEKLPHILPAHLGRIGAEEPEAEVGVDVGDVAEAFFEEGAAVGAGSWGWVLGGFEETGDICAVQGEGEDGF